MINVDIWNECGEVEFSDRVSLSQGLVLQIEFSWCTYLAFLLRPRHHQKSAHHRKTIVSSVNWGTSIGVKSGTVLPTVMRHLEPVWGFLLKDYGDVGLVSWELMLIKVKIKGSQYIICDSSPHIKTEVCVSRGNRWMSLKVYCFLVVTDHFLSIVGTCTYKCYVMYICRVQSRWHTYVVWHMRGWRGRTPTL